MEQQEQSIPFYALMLYIMHTMKPVTILIEELCQSNAITGKSQVQLSFATGVQQYQISRIVTGRIKRHTPALIKLCKYAHINLDYSRQEDPDGRYLIEKTLLSTWDGSHAQAKKIARLLKLAMDMH